MRKVPSISGYDGRQDKCFLKQTKIHDIQGYLLNYVCYIYYKFKVYVQTLLKK
jgi:hypothetical protein